VYQHANKYPQNKYFSAIDSDFFLGGLPHASFHQPKLNGVHKNNMLPYEKRLRLILRPCRQAQFFHIKTKTYLSRPQKGTFKGLPGVALSRGQHIAGHQKKHSFTHSFFPSAPLSYPCSLSHSFHMNHGARL
jgi:hypothetical protein